MWYDSVASEQQIGQSPAAGRRSHLQDRRRHEDLSGGESTERLFDQVHMYEWDRATFTFPIVLSKISQDQGSVYY